MVNRNPVPMMTVAGGEIALSDRRSRRRWTAPVAPFALAAVPVTRALYAEVTGQRPGAARGDRLPVETVSWWDALRFCNALSRRDGLTPAYRLTAPVLDEPPAPGGPPGGPIERNGPLSPVDRLLPGGDVRAGDGEPGVVWDRDADGYRLPIEAEWEYACRAGTDGPRYGPLDDVAWHRGNSGERPHDVGTRRANPWGLHDMLGNVWEWCWDVYDAEVYGTYRVLRGGGWFDEHWSCRASVRRRSHPTLCLDDIGFRVARNATTV
ncbi:formylglycine-generating enzyme family protein [Actinoplanes xinjiangensis]|uniref:formylglycine-generating enzyme family protein n=1 Tax=Actinoplanes xinjiangensis TaxID=512350 RepID=UPI003F4E29D5